MPRTVEFHLLVLSKLLVEHREKAVISKSIAVSHLYLVLSESSKGPSGAEKIAASHCRLLIFPSNYVSSGDTGQDIH